MVKKSLTTLAIFFAAARIGLVCQTMSTVEPLRNVDRAYRFAIKNPAYPKGKGPVVLIDEMHNNFHTAVGTYFPFAGLLQKDGYVVRRGRESLSAKTLDKCEVYVIADAQPPPVKGSPPTFSLDEIAVINAWVQGGGSLFVITDHMPDPGAVDKLASSFGIEVNNGYVLNRSPSGMDMPLVFRKADGSLKDHNVTKGRNPLEEVYQVATFAGSAFRIRGAKGFLPILVFGKGRRSWMPQEYWRFPPGTPSVSVEGWYQGGVSDYGRGRIAFFSEAAMFTAQVFDNGRVKAGMNNSSAKDNAQLLLNIMHWLSGIL